MSSVASCARQIEAIFRSIVPRVPPTPIGAQHGAGRRAIRRRVGRSWRGEPDAIPQGQVSRHGAEIAHWRGAANRIWASRQWPLKSGAIFSEQDVRGANKVCVIGQTTARQLFGDSDAVGQIIRIKQVPFIIVGVLAPKGLSMMGSDQDDVVMRTVATSCSSSSSKASRSVPSVDSSASRSESSRPSCSPISPRGPR